MESTDFSWGHGFVPRIGGKQFVQVDRALSPASLLGEPVELPWAIVDLHWAITKPHLLDHLRQSGTRLLFDSQAWRYRELPTFEMEKFRELSYAPKEPIVGPGTALRDFVRHDMAAQAGLKADAYLIPGFVPHSRDDDVIGLTVSAVDHAIAALADVPPKPLVVFLGAHTRNPVAVEGLVSELHGAVAGAYLQLTPVQPTYDSPAKLVSVARMLLHCKDQGISVLGGRLAAIGTLLRSVGVDAVDGGLAEGESFVLNDLVRRPKTSSAVSKGPGRGPRLYVPQLGGSMYVSRYSELVANQQIAARLVCRGLCCRFRKAAEIGQRAGEHSLRCRVDETVELAQLPAGMQPRYALDVLRAKSSLLSTLNGVLLAEGKVPLPTRQIDNMLAALERLLDKPAAA